ncbi:bifunctional glycosyltransferase family 2 protein/CDP-glycerol:glycerophosphate glycerophosphotransferase [Arthrobacter sp. APC 3897]|uniref:bifunctional glycosyltransferase/CDP-glycerol:glycerophosphate glycerophosphotransferase n=1 Tax=Arthrobacter sp. APC 3897 TaxID=3035204 RepID=UPI0025B5AF79|nr:bifunctional glycosyltransferase family 2 protein/CDP-glycerol:glycerophosphate glycerophosphotransferase [Arthrobacter sp. APC 3897]MDN3482262.1 bifunctional glycosyltransferase family 2 protein/CDP-glycerol:glycerophosphate glycerophosphotransferase [Arthrobacter sp. APC 3897]
MLPPKVAIKEDNLHVLDSKSKPAPQHLGTISVIIPVYNVEDYLAECVESITSQSYPHLEILLINDGSTDSSVAIAEALASSDTRIRLINKDNAGLGAARNTGIKESTGDFLSFVDSDDIIPRDAYTQMIRTLTDTGSDFVVGTIRRLTNGVRRVPAWAERLHAEPQHGISVEDCPGILQDVFACNKLFRKTFWDLNIGQFPEGVLYEDQETTAKAYLLSTKFDVVKEVVYDWRIRSDNSSITQQKERYVDVRDRLAAIDCVAKLLQEAGKESTRIAWLARTLGPDLGQYYSLIPRVDDKYWKELQRGVERLAADLDDAVLNEMSPHHKILVRLIGSADRKNAEKVVLHLAEYGHSFEIEKDHSGLTAKPAYLEDIDYIPEPGLMRVDPKNLSVKSRLTAMRKTGPRSMEISGYAFIEGLSPKYYPGVPRVELIDILSSQRIELGPIKRSDFDVDAVDGDPWVSYAGTGFVAEVDLDSLPTGPQHDGSEWALSLSLSLDNENITSNFLTKDAGGTTASMPLLDAAGNRRLITRFSKQYGLSFFDVKQRRFVTELSVEDQTVNLSVTGAPGEDLVGIRIECPKLGIELDGRKIPGPADEAAKFIIDVPTLNEDQPPTANYMYKVRVISSDGKLHHIAWPTDIESLNRTSEDINNLRATVSGYGYLELTQQRWRLVIDDASYDAATNELKVEYRAKCVVGTPPYLTLPPLVLASDAHRVRPSKTEVLHGSGAMTTTFVLNREKHGSSREVLTSGTYTVRCATESLGGESHEYWIPVTKDLELRLPQELTTQTTRLKLGRTPRAGALALQVLAPLDTSERGKYRQRTLQDRIPEFSELPLEPGAVLFESFGGKSVTDSGLALFNEMDRRDDPRTRYWSVVDLSVHVPTGAVPLIRYSEEWYRKLHTVEYLVNNNNFPFYYRKRAGQKYVQTWHGTPLKRIGNDIPSTHLSLPYVNLMQREARYWDFLLAQNDFSAEVLPRAFGTSCRVVTEGYPRNDTLVQDDHYPLRAAVRSRLGIDEDKTVVLYAPTWRDYLRGQGNRYQMSSFLDFQKANDRLGANFVFLVRGHSNVAGQVPALTNLSCIDVTDYEDINELYTASDLLVTDYSSVMFDYCVTGKPMYFLAPDLERYRDSVRGFYFDFESTSPGPIVASTESLVESILQGPTTAYADKYESFRKLYASHDDGKAAQRVYDHIWGASHL